MQPWPLEYPHPRPSQSTCRPTLEASQDGTHSQQPTEREPSLSLEWTRASDTSEKSDDKQSPDGPSGSDAGQVDFKPCNLSKHADETSSPAERGKRQAGQRITDYEKYGLASAPANHTPGFKVVKRHDPRSGERQISDLPNEILTHVLSHLHPDSHAAVALVSRRFYSLVTTSHAWRMAFLRYFPGHESLSEHGSSKTSLMSRGEDATDLIRSETRYFGRLTSMATWRSEYLLRTRLLRGLARGKPSAIGSSSRSGKRATAVLTYNSKLPWAVTSLHAVFVNGKKPPRAVHGTSEIGVSTMSDPVVGKVEKWGFVDPYSAQQPEDVAPQLQLWGFGEGPAASRNVLDVSSVFGTLSGEGVPGGSAYYRSTTELCGRYLGAIPSAVDAHPDVPRIPEFVEAVSAVWLAKSSAVPSMTDSMVGILTGSTLGVVTAYAVGWDSNSTQFSAGDMTARWAVSPGVPIISIRVDEQYNSRRKSTNRIWAVALNALGEVFYLCDTPKAHPERVQGDAAKNAWYAGRTAYWRIIDVTCRQARADGLDMDACGSSNPPRSSCNAMGLSSDQLIAEARAIDIFLRHRPSHFRRIYEGWDMRRSLEVDFAADDGKLAGEVVVVITPGWEDGLGPHICHYTRSIATCSRLDSPAENLPVEQGTPDTAYTSTDPSSLFGFGNSPPVLIDKNVALVDEDAPSSQGLHCRSAANERSVSCNWRFVPLSLRRQSKTEITSSALEESMHASMTLAEDPLSLPNSESGEIPGRRARLLAVGTSSGTALVWNIRDTNADKELSPVRVVQTDSPEISSIALNGLYLVLGGSDGLVQAWDLLASTLDPIRTLNARPSGRVPRHMIAMNPGLSHEHHSAARAILLDPDPTTLRGIVAFGSFLRYWSYSATSRSPGHKRRLRHANIHGRPASRREGGNVSGYIAAEAAELRHEQDCRERERTRLQNRFGVGAFGDMTEEEAVLYAQMMSEETFAVDEQRRTSASDTGSATDCSPDTASSFGGISAPSSVPERSTGSIANMETRADDESKYEMQVQQALRLSLLEGVTNYDCLAPETNPTNYEIPITFKPRLSRKSKTPASSPVNQAGLHTSASSSAMLPAASQEEEDFALALKLSMEEHDLAADAGSFKRHGGGHGHEEYPPLAVEGKGKKKQL